MPLPRRSRKPGWPSRTRPTRRTPASGQRKSQRRRNGTRRPRIPRPRLAEPDPVADLAAQLEELRGRLARAEGEVGGLRARYEDETGPAMLALSQAKQMRAELNEAIEKRKLKPPPAPWWLVGRDQGAAMLTDLRGWFDG